MATTTNYGWTTPNDTDLVKDGAAAIRTLGSSIDTTVFANAGASIPKAIVDAKGDIIAATAADTVARLAVGANGTVLTADSAEATGLKWATPAGGGGKVLQVVNATYSTQTTTTSTSYADTGLTANITPSAATSKILVLVNHAGCHRAAGSANGNLVLQLLRSGTSIIVFENYFGFNSGSIEINGGSCSTSYLDTPNTTASITYKTEQKIGGSTGTFATQANGGTSTITLIEIGA